MSPDTPPRTPRFTTELAPMEGVTALPYRLWQSLIASPAVMTTPFLRATATYPHRELPLDFAPELRQDLRGAVSYTLRPQIMAADEGCFVKAARYFLDDTASVELNGGCPSPTCTGKGAGSSLLRDAEEWRAFIDRLSHELGPVRLAVKMRTGYETHEEFPALIEAIAGLPLARLTVHGRTRPQGYKGKARWDLIATAGERVTAPVVASGDVVDAASARALRRAAPSIHTALIGRGALRNPWVFAELDDAAGPERESVPVAVPNGILGEALHVYALLQEAGGRDPSILVEWMAQGRFVDQGAAGCGLGLDHEAWQAWRRRASEDLGFPSDTPWVRATLGRVKMLWNYWRSSLPPAYFSPETLRSKTLEELLARIEAISNQRALEHGETSFIPRHRSDLDWIYAGEKRTITSC